jgi:hypothetical protein
MVTVALLGWRHMEVTERRTAVDFAGVVRWLVEDLHSEAEKLVMDNLYTHKLTSLYEAFPPEQARRIAGRLEVHHTQARVVAEHVGVRAERAGRPVPGTAGRNRVAVHDGRRPHQTLAVISRC